MHVVDGPSARCEEARALEKPFSRRADEVEEAFDLADKEGLVLSEGFMWRHHPQTAALTRLVAEGAIGRLRMIRAAFSFQLAPRPGPGPPSA